MAKILQDMVQNKTSKNTEDFFANKKNIKDIPKPNDNYDYTKKKEEKGHGLWFVAVIAIVFLIFAISVLFSRADITVVPKVVNSSIDSNITFTGVKNTSDDELPFNLVVLSGDETKTVATTGVKNITTKAIGQVTLLNSFSTIPQNLSLNTKLEGTNGKIYHLDSKISIPGMSKTGTPGMIDAGIYADKEGEEYNSTPINFKIAGFKGSSKYEKIYAISKGDISGGFVGTQPYIAPEDMTNAIADLKTSLQTKLLQKASDQLPDGFILYKDAISMEYDQNPIIPVLKDDGAELTQKGTLYGFIFDEKKLSSKIASNLIKDYDNSDIYIPNIKDLTFSLLTQDGTSGADATTLTFNLTGNPKIVYKIDTDKLMIALLGSDKKDFNNILAKYPNIASADLSVKPMWKSSLPDKDKNINIKINYPN